MIRFEVAFGSLSVHFGVLVWNNVGFLKLPFIPSWMLVNIMLFKLLFFLYKLDVIPLIRRCRFACPYSRPMVCAVKSKGPRTKAFLRVLKYSTGGVLEVISYYNFSDNLFLG